MSDTEYKTIKPPKAHAPAPVAQVSSPSGLYRGPWGDALRVADTVFGARPIVWSGHMGGALEWLAASEAVDTGSQNQPTDVWRTITRARIERSPAQALDLRALCLPSGPIVKFYPFTGQWNAIATGGRIGVDLDYTSELDASTDAAAVERLVPASVEEDATDPTAPGSAWERLRHVFVPSIIPGGATALAVAATFSEWPSIDVTLKHRGGVRMIAANLAGVVHEHVAAHDSDETTLHAYAVAQGQPHPDALPQTDSPDGATYEERRFGTRRGLQVADRQRQRLGPPPIVWSSYSERLTDVDDTEAAPVEITDTAPRRISVREYTDQFVWDANAAGLDFGSHYHRRAPEHFRQATQASVPVLCRVYCKWASAPPKPGFVRWATSSRSSITLEVPTSQTTAGWLSIRGWLESTIAPDDAYPILQDWAWVATSGTLQIWAWSVTVGDYAVALP